MHLTKYDDVFEAPVKLVARELDHRTDLIDPKAPPPHPRLHEI